MVNPMRDDDRLPIEPIDDEFSRLPPDERRRLTDEWLDSLRRREPVELGISGAELIAEARRDEGWE